MATSLFTPGPAEIAVGLGSGQSYLYLGQTVNGARSRVILHTGNVQGDAAGVDGQPLDMRISGRGIVVTMQVNKFDPQVMAAVEGRFFGGLGGTIQANEIGSLALTEGLAFPMMIRSRYATTHTAFSGFATGLRVLWCIVSGELGKDYSTKEQTYDLTFFGLVNMNTTTLTGTCYDFNTTGFPAAT